MVWGERFGKLPKTVIAHINKADECGARHLQVTLACRICQGGAAPWPLFS
jgi:hypothetical protein